MVRPLAAPAVGLEEKTSGKLEFYSGDGNHTASSERVGIVFQEPRLMPWLTVREKHCFSQYNKRNEKKNLEVVDEYLEILGLQGLGRAVLPSWRKMQERGVDYRRRPDRGYHSGCS